MDTDDTRPPAEEPSTEAREAMADPEVSKLIDELREDADDDVRLAPEAASEHIGTGTDR